MNEKWANGIINASPEKRYKSFLNTITDLEKVWLLSSQNGFATIDIDGDTCIMLWPRKEFCGPITARTVPTPIEIHNFQKWHEKLADSTKFAIFPTSKDSYVVTAKQLYQDIAEHLEELE